jgi:hypothetical protein
MSDRPPPSLTTRLTIATAVLESRRGSDLGEEGAPAPRWAVLALVLALLCLGAATLPLVRLG